MTLANLLLKCMSLLFSQTIICEYRVGLLTFLNYFAIGKNSITGTIPTEIGSWRNMAYFALFDNSLSSTIPSELGRFENATSFFVHRNYLTGVIPTEIGNLTKIEAFRFENNLLSGTVPDEICYHYNFGDLQVVASDCTEKVECACCDVCCPVLIRTLDTETIDASEIVCKENEFF